MKKLLVGLLLLGLCGCKSDAPKIEEGKSVLYVGSFGVHPFKVGNHDWFRYDRSMAHDPDCKLCFKREMMRDMAILTVIERLIQDSQNAKRETISIADRFGESLK